MQYEYHINLDERGEFSSDVRNPATEQSIFEIDTETLSSLVEDGFLSHGRDIAGLFNYLGMHGLISGDDSIVSPY